MGSELLELTARELKRELRLRGLDTSGSFDRETLLELAAVRGLIPAAAEASPRRRRRRGIRDPMPAAPVVVALRRVAASGEYLPSGLFTDGERFALPLWSEVDQSTGPMWFLLDTAIRTTTLAASAARRLGVPAGGGMLRGLRFGREPVAPLRVQLIPDDAAVLGPQGAGVVGLLGLDFLFSWDLDLDVPRRACRAWPAGPELPRGFGPRDAVEIELLGRQGLLEVQARLRGTVCSGSDKAGPLVRAVVDLGQTYSACNWAAARQLGVLSRDSPCVRPAGQWLDLDGLPIDVCEADLGVELPGRVSGVLSGSRVLEKRLFWLADKLPLLERMGFDQANPCAILGLDTVGRARLVISARHRRLFLPG